MRARNRWSKAGWCAAIALGAIAAGCTDRSPVAVEQLSTSDAASRSTSATGTVSRVVVYPLTYTLKRGLTKQMVAVPRSSSGATLSLNGRTVRWASSNSTVASVSASGVVTARAAGKVVISATVDGVRGTATITVTAPIAVASVAVTPGSKSLARGQYVSLTATPRDASGRPVSGHTISWGSSNSAVAKVYSNGLVQAVAPGTATIRASAGGKVGYAKITVTKTTTTTTTTTSPTGVASVVVYPLSYTLNIGLAKQLIAIPRNSSGQTMSLSGRTVTWASSNPAVATVSSGGLVIGRAAGTVTVTATVDGKKGSSTIMVTKPY